MAFQLRVRTPGTILCIGSDGAYLYTLESALRKSTIRNPIHLARYPEEAKCFLAGAGIYHDRSAYPPPDIIVIDLEMRHRAGFEMLTWIRKQRNFAAIPVITAGNLSDHADVQFAFDEGANACFRKGLEIRELVDLIENLEFIEDILDRERKGPSDGIP